MTRTTPVPTPPSPNFRTAPADHTGPGRMMPEAQKAQNKLWISFSRRPTAKKILLHFNLERHLLAKYGIGNLPYCSAARRKTLSRVASNRRVEERRDTDVKSTATFGNLSALPLGEEFVFERSTKRNEISAGSIYAK
ncbi:hypothetical protein AVEN_138134-1 [Araneus ventricosus]|uniref:Uncharacterized protein n=1 Tax=Araneus ventricosus TaxID=182803 RepID=A0A4Y2F7A0_ARAVE|nr:hypothetical protein AVEN_138134-1 [Araneus ventricosus]